MDPPLKPWKEIHIGKLLKDAGYFMRVVKRTREKSMIGPFKVSLTGLLICSLQCSLETYF